MRPHPTNRTLSEAARNASISTKLNFSAPSTLIIHPQLARSDSFRLILRWNQLPRSGSSCVGQEYESLLAQSPAYNEESSFYLSRTEHPRSSQRTLDARAHQKAASRRDRYPRARACSRAPRRNQEGGGHGRFV